VKTNIQARRRTASSLRIREIQFEKNKTQKLQNIEKSDKNIIFMRVLKSINIKAGE